ncbi:MAG: GFA family protein [Gammaproteobacteria bacterium]|nr:GFA family protein [Gammaproteobacteria bacterium]
MNKTKTGSCLCGAVGYEIRGAPLAMYYCHCEQCRKACGSSFATNLAVAEKDFHLVRGAEKLKSFASSPGKKRHFCGGCGSPVFNEMESLPGKVYVRAGTVDGGPEMAPGMHIYTDFKAPWFTILDGLPQRKAAEGIPF